MAQEGADLVIDHNDVLNDALEAAGYEFRVWHLEALRAWARKHNFYSDSRLASDLRGYVEVWADARAQHLVEQLRGCTHHPSNQNARCAKARWHDGPHELVPYEPLRMEFAGNVTMIHPRLAFPEGQAVLIQGLEVEPGAVNRVLSGDVNTPDEPPSE